MVTKTIQNIIDVCTGKKRICVTLEPNITLSPKKKIKVISHYAQKYNCVNVVETGTYLGKTLFALKNIFRKLYSIELSEDLYLKACERFKNYRHVKLYQGDSSDVLPEVLKDINEKTLFWLDGHYSAGITAKGKKDTPILEELDAIYRAKKLNHVLLIDDARCFGVEPDYPSIDELKNYILSKWDNSEFSVEQDIIRIVLN